MDRLTSYNKKNSTKGNLIKWWEFKMVDPEPENLASEDMKTEEVLPGITRTVINGVSLTSLEMSKEEYMDVYENQFSSSEQELFDSIVSENRMDNAFDKASSVVDEMQEDNQALQEANEIYERLMREAMEDDMKKQQEIEAAKLANM